MLKVDLTLVNSFFRISPNPTRGPVYLEIANAMTGTLQVCLSDVRGRILRTWTFSKTTLSWTQSIDPGNLPPGSYFISVYGSSFKEVRQFIRR